MKLPLQRCSEVSISRRGRIRRRDFLRFAGAGLAVGGLTWSNVAALRAEELKRRDLSCIVLWMQGGPSQFETWDPKPGHANGGETKAIDTSVAGIQISENLPQLADVMEHLCLLRSLTSREGSHPRATYLMHTSYIPTASVQYPSLGSHVAHQLGEPSAELPSYVRIGQVRNGAGAGILGVDYDPFVVPQAGTPPQNSAVVGGTSRYESRLDLLADLDSQFAEAGAAQEVNDHRKLYGKASRMVLSPEMETFDLSRESESVRSAYGGGQFAQGCLLARRLVEAGVPFVEVNAGNWDTHLENFERSRQLCGQIDRPFAQLVRDLHERGLLDRTLILWVGEFGRTPRINPRAGRDHFPRAFSGVLAGGGIRGGQVIGRTTAGGDEVAERPISVHDLFRTLCHALRIDADHENHSSGGRPIKIVDGGAPVMEAFG